MAKNSQDLAAAAAGVTTQDMGERVRVHALAKSLGISSAELIEVLTDQGIADKRAASTLPKDQVGQVLETLRASGTADVPRPAEQKKAPAKKAPAKKAPAKEAPAKKAPAKEAAAKKAPAKEAAAKKAPAKEAAAKKAPAKKAPAKKTAATKATAKKAAAAKAPATTPSVETEPVSPVAEPVAAESTTQDKPVTKTTSRRSRRGRKATAAEQATKAAAVASEAGPEKPAQPTKTAAAPVAPAESAAPTEQTVDALIDRIADSVESGADSADTAAATTAAAPEEPRKVRRRVVRRVGSRSAANDAEMLRTRHEAQRQADEPEVSTPQSAVKGDASKGDAPKGDQESVSRSSRRGGRGRGRGRGDQDRQQQGEGSTQQEEVTGKDTAPTGTAPGERSDHGAPSDDHGVPGNLEVLTEGTEIVDEPVKLKGSTRLESKRRWRQEQGNDKRKIVSKAEFLARRENVDRSMVVRDSERSDHPGTTTQVGITEDGMLVEHFVTSETQSSITGNIYLGRVQNVLSSMEAAFIDIGTGRNAVLYAGEVDWRNKHLHARTRRIEAALKPGDQVLVQVIKDPLGHKGARLTNRLSFAGRYLVYVPGGKSQGISRKLPESERKRLKDILGRVVPENGGTIIRTAAEGVSEELIAEDVNRLHQRWLDILDREEKARARKSAQPVTMYEEPNMLVKVIRDVFNEDFNELIVDGDKSWSVARDYVREMAPDLEDRVVRYRPEEHGGRDVFADRQLDDQLAKALSQKVWLPSGGYLIIDRTEAMTVIDVNTGSFVGSGGNLEETVTRNNLEAAEEIVRQMRLRDMGGMIVVDFIDMVLAENRDLVLRRLSEFLGRDRTRHKVSEVTSLGLVQMTRKRLGTGLLETFSTECPMCEGRGVIIHDDPVEHTEDEDDRNGNGGHSGRSDRRDHGHRAEKRQARDQQETRRRHEQAREAEHSDDRVGSAAESRRDSDGDAASTRNRSRRSRRGSRTTGDPGQAPTQVEAPVQVPQQGDGAEHGEESATGQGTRRGRRRVVRRVEHPDAYPDAHPEQAGTGRAGNAGDVAAIAAYAVKRAGAEDPDEPSGADYVPDEPAGSTASGAATARPVVETDGRGRRRVRRVVRPAAGRTVSATPVPETTAGETYVEAKAEFDASPRRRRQTRGRSRSDIAPDPRDFSDAQVEVTDAASETQSAAVTSRGAVSHRGRRRVVRSSR